MGVRVLLCMFAGGASFFSVHKSPTIRLYKNSHTLNKNGKFKDSLLIIMLVELHPAGVSKQRRIYLSVDIFGTYY